MKYFFLILFQIQCFLSFGQLIGNYIPLVFDELDPLWTYTSVDSTIIGHEIEAPSPYSVFDGYSHLFSSRDIEQAPLIDGDYLYHIHRTSYDRDVSGGLIEKIDLRTGEVQWNSVFDLRTSEYREFIERTILKGDTLILINHKVTSPDLEEFPFPIVAFGFIKGVLKIRKYDVRTGELLEESVADDTHPNVKVLDGDSNNCEQINIISEKQLEVIKYIWNVEQGPKLIIDTIGYDGLYINEPDTVFTNFENVDWTDFFATGGHKFFRATDGTLYWLDSYVPDNNFSGPARAYLRIDDGTEEKLVSLNEFDINYADVYRWYMIDLSEEYILLRLHYYSSDYSDYVLLDREGQLIKIMKNDFDTSAVPFTNSKGKLVNIDQGGFGDDGKFYLKFYQSEGNTMINTASFAVSNSDYIVIEAEIYPLENGDYLVSVIHAEYEGGTSYLGRFMTLFRVTPEMIGFEPISTEQTASNSSVFGVNIFPNPTFKNTTIQFEEFYTGTINVLDVNGRLLERFDINNVQNYSIYLDHYIKGVYILNFKNQQINQSVKILKTK